MAELIFDHAAYVRFYNCNAYNFQTVPLEERRQLAFGLLTLGFSIVLECLYVPCLVVIAKRQNRSQSCYKFMLALGVTNCLTIAWIGIAQTAFAIEGAVFCAQPTQMYMVGMGNNVLWFIETGINLLLALNRLLSICHRPLTELLFDGQRVWLWLVFPLGIALFMAFNCRPYIFNAILRSWFQNPHMGYLEALNGQENAFYYSRVQLAYNCTLLVALFSIYATFLVVLALKRRGSIAQQGGQQQQQRDIRIFLQVFWITFFCALAALGFNFERYLFQFPALLQFLTFGYLLHQGTPALVYLMLNQSIRVQLFRCTPISGISPVAPAPNSWKGTVIVSSVHPRVKIGPKK